MLFEDKTNSSPTNHTHNTPFPFTYPHHHHHNLTQKTCSYSYHHNIIPTQRHFTSLPLTVTSLELEAKRRYLISLVLHHRSSFAQSISHFMHISHNKISLRKSLLVKRIIILRTSSVTLIQNTLRTFLIRKHVKEILGNTEALFLYQFKYSPETVIAARFKRDLVIPLEYSKYLDSYYLPIRKMHSFKRRIKVRIMINGSMIIDTNYPVANDSKGNYYNVISTGLLFRKVKERSPKFQKRIKEKKYYEELFECRRKQSVDFTSDRSDVSTELNHSILWTYGSSNRKGNNRQGILKSILKTRKHKDMEKGKDEIVVNERKVTFANSIEVSY